MDAGTWHGCQDPQAMLDFLRSSGALTAWEDAIMPEPSTSDKASRKDLEHLQGAWRAVSVEVDGSPVACHHFENATLVIAGDRFTLRNPLPDADQTTEGVFRVDAATVPKGLVLALDNGQSIQEIYELDGDTLKVCYPIRPGNRPTDFKASPRLGLSVVVYERDRMG
jgi:uncharacterized protein (TIGR03067 family)